MKTNIVAYGGSIVIPTKAYDQNAMTQLADIIKEFENDRFVLIIGGGTLARNVSKISKPILIDANLSSQEIDIAFDELGIATTKINARKVISSLTEFLGEDVVCQEYIDNPEIVPNTNHRVYIASGFRPNVTTDYCMLKLAEKFNAKSAFKISNFKIVLDVKPLEFNKSLIESYKELPKLNWTEINELVGTDFMPGGNYPLDPPSAKLGKQLSVINKDFTLFIGQKEEFEKMLKDEKFVGTVIKDE